MKIIVKCIKKYYRYVFLAIISLIQVLLTLYLSFSNIFKLPFVFIPSGVLTLAAIIYTIARKEREFSKLPWCILLLVFPFPALVGFLLYSNGFSVRKLTKKIENSTPEIPQKFIDSAVKETNSIIKKEETKDYRASQTVKYLYEKCGYPAFKGGRSNYYPSGEEAYEDILKDLRCAERFVFIEFFIIEKCSMFDEIMSILAEKAANGVDVRLIYDDFGNMASVSSRFNSEVEKKYPGVKCMKFHKVSLLAMGSINCRDHRKIIVVDGKCCYTGGFNIADRYINRVSKYGYWKDSVIRLEGGAVDSFTFSFIQFWNSFRKDKVSSDSLVCNSTPGSKGIIQPFFDSPYSDDNICKNLIIDIISRATSSLYIFSPYLIPDEGIESALILAAERGVKITMFAQEITDKKAVYRSTLRLLRKMQKRGATIYKFKPGFIHSKIILADLHFGYIGTSNMDLRSLYYNYECGIYLEDEPVLAQIEVDFKNTINKNCERVTSEDLECGFFMKICDALISLCDPLF